MEEQKLVMKYFGEEEFGNIIKYASENRHCLFDLPTLLNIHPFFREDFNAAKTLEEQKSIIDAADRVYEICTTDGKKICFLIKEKDFDEFQIFLNPENWGKTDKPITYDKFDGPNYIYYIFESVTKVITITYKANADAEEKVIKIYNDAVDA